MYLFFVDDVMFIPRRDDSAAGGGGSLQGHVRYDLGSLPHQLILQDQDLFGVAYGENFDPPSSKTTNSYILPTCLMSTWMQYSLSTNVLIIVSSMLPCMFPSQSSSCPPPLHPTSLGKAGSISPMLLRGTSSGSIQEVDKESNT